MQSSGLRLYGAKRNAEPPIRLDDESVANLRSALDAALAKIERAMLDKTAGMELDLSSLTPFITESAPVVMVGYPCYRDGLSPAFVHSTHLLDYGPCHVLFRPQPGRHQAQCRNDLAEAALAAGCTHLLMLDTDMLYPRDTLTRLLAANVPVICGFSVARTPMHQPLFGPRRGPYQFLTQYPTIDGTMTGARLYGPQRSFMVGGAALLIHTDVFRRLPKPWFSFSGVMDDGREPGEDLYFAEQCHRAGIPCYVHTDVIVSHEAQVALRPFYDDARQRWDVAIDGVGPFLDPQPPETKEDKHDDDGKT